MQPRETVVYMEEVTLPKPHSQEMPGPLSSFNPRPEPVCSLSFDVYFPLALARGAPGSPGPCWVDWGSCRLSLSMVWAEPHVQQGIPSPLSLPYRQCTTHLAAGSSRSGWVPSCMCICTAFPFAQEHPSLLSLAVQNSPCPLFRT